MAIAGAIVAVVGLAISEDARQDAQEAQEEQIRAQRAVDTTKLARERRAAVREKRIKQAQVEQAAQTGGVSGSSGALTAPGVLATQFATASGLQAGFQEARTVSDRAMIKATKAQFQGQMGQSISSIGFKTFAAGGGFDAFGSVESDVEGVLNTEGLF